MFHNDLIQTNGFLWKGKPYTVFKTTQNCLDFSAALEYAITKLEIYGQMRIKSSANESKGNKKGEPQSNLATNSNKYNFFYLISRKLRKAAKTTTHQRLIFKVQKPIGVLFRSRTIGQSI